MSPAPASRAAIARWLVARTGRLLPTLVVAVLARVVSQLLGVGFLVLAATGITSAAAGAAMRRPVLVGWLVGLALAKAALRYLEHYVGHWVAFAALQRLRELLFARLVPQAPAAVQGRAGAELTERATGDIDRVEVFFAHTLPPAAAAVLVPAVSLAWLGTRVDPRLALLLAIPVAAVVVLVPLLGARASWRSADAVAARRGELAARVGDDTQGVREVLAFDATGARLDGLDRADGRLAAARRVAGRVEATRSAVVLALQTGSLVLVAGAAGALGVPVAGAAAALAVAIGLWVPSRGIEGFATGLDASFAAADRIRHVIEAEPLVRDPAQPVPAGPRRPAAASFAGVDFRYPGDRVEPALDDVTLRFEPGHWSYLVGVSGSGKSTAAALLLRGWDPISGTVRLDGTDARDLPLDALRTRVGLVPQHPTTVTGTLADNLRLANPDASDDRLHAALAVAGLDRWADGLPQGLATPIQGRGTGLSGGELQRLALARALAAEPDLLVLDEALSQLDAATGTLVRGRLAAHPTGRGTIVEITHRIDLVPDDALVVVLDAGRVLEAGTASTLRQAGGPFARLEARG